MIAVAPRATVCGQLHSEKPGGLHNNQPPNEQCVAQTINWGREAALDCGSPPTEPDWRISRIRLSS